LLPTCETAEQYPRPLNDSLPIKDLAIHPGYQCEHCDDILTESKSIVQKRVSPKHKRNSQVDSIRSLYKHGRYIDGKVIVQLSIRTLPPPLSLPNHRQVRHG